MTYKHQYTDGTTIHYPLGKVVCIGRNYAEHAKELNNPVPVDFPILIRPDGLDAPGAARYSLADLIRPGNEAVVNGLTHIPHTDGLPLAHLHGEPVHLGLALCIDGGGEGRMNRDAHKYHAVGT